MSTVDPKVFATGPYAMAFAGDFRVGQVLKYHFNPPEPPQDPEVLQRFMVTGFVNRMTEAMKKGGLWTKEEGLRIQDSEFIVAVKKRVFWVGPDLGILEMRDNMIAIGAGKEYALGSLVTSEGAPADVRVRKALEAANRFCPWVKPPYTIIRCT